MSRLTAVFIGGPHDGKAMWISEPIPTILLPLMPDRNPVLFDPAEPTEMTSIEIALYHYINPVKRDYNTGNLHAVTEQSVVKLYEFGGIQR